jgi:hypothetical protein
MKDEQLQQAAKEIVREFVRYCDQTPDHEAAALAILRRVVSQARAEGRDEGLDEAARLARNARDGQQLSLISDPYIRGCVEAASAIELAIRALKKESGQS